MGAGVTRYWAKGKRPRDSAVAPSIRAVRPKRDEIDKGCTRVRGVVDEKNIGAMLEHLSGKDAILGDVIKVVGPPDAWIKGATTEESFQRGSSCTSLVRSICGQQISTKAAASIFGRVLAKYPAEGDGLSCSASALASADEDELKTLGLSGRKATYVKGIAERFATQALTDEALTRMTDAEVTEALTDVKGIGKWTADMFLIFHLRRQDVLPEGDLGVRKGAGTLYSGGKAVAPAALEAIAESWRPYRSVGSYYMWRVGEYKRIKSEMTS